MKRESLKAAGILAVAVFALCGCGKAVEDKAAAESGNAAENEPVAESEDAVEDKAAAESGGVGESGDLPLAGSTFSIAGDSISTFQDYNPAGYYAFFPGNGDVKDVRDTWWQQVAENLELQMIANASSSGAMVAGDSAGTNDPQCACNEFRTDALFGPDGACPDRIIVYLGANDMIEGVPPGDNDGTRAVEEGETASFSDAYTLMLDKLQAKYPSAKIYCCTLHRMGTYGTETPYVEFVNGIGLTAEDYGAVIAGIAEARGLAVVDLYNCGITLENLQEMTSDGVHPTAAGMRCIAEAVEEALSCG